MQNSILYTNEKIRRFHSFLVMKKEDLDKNDIYRLTYTNNVLDKRLNFMNLKNVVSDIDPLNLQSFKTYLEEIAEIKYPNQKDNLPLILDDFIDNKSKVDVFSLNVDSECDFVFFQEKPQEHLINTFLL